MMRGVSREMLLGAMIYGIQLQLFGFIRKLRKKAAKASPAATRSIRPRTLRPPKNRRSSGKSDPALLELWRELRRDYFPDRADIDDYIVRWSGRRQIRTLASCNPEKRRVNVARELNYPKHFQWLKPLLYHEMCHAVLYQHMRREGDYRHHGREFKALERRHPEIQAFNQWIKSGGWLSAVRSSRARDYHQQKKAQGAS